MARSGRLIRSNNNQILFGVCGALADYFGVSPFIVRLIFFILLLPGGLPGIVPYIVLTLLIPKED